MNRDKLALAALAMLVGVLHSSQSFAAPLVVPGNADGSRVIEDMKKVPAPVSTTPTVTKPAVTSDKAPIGADKANFLLKKVILEGVTAYQEKDLTPIYQDSLGKTIPLSKIYEFAAAITQRYHDDGYGLSRAVIPPQEINGGTIKIKVLEGYVDKIDVEGPYKKTDISENMIAKIKAYKPLNMKDLERQMLLLNDLAGVSVKAVLKLPEDKNKAAEGATDLSLIFTNTPITASLSYDNYGSRYIGPYEASFSAGINNILPYQQTNFNGLITTPLNELQYISISHTLPVDSNGTTANLQFSLAHSEPGYKLDAQDVVSHSYDYGIFFSHPLLRSRAENLYIGGGFEMKNSNTDVLASELYDDRIRIASINGSYDFSDNWAGSNQVSTKFSQGLNILGARETGSTNLSRNNGHSDFTKVNANASRLQGITNEFQLYAAASGQYAWSSLLSSEQFGFGGQQFGRAYDSSEITGDDGIAGAAEFRYSGLPVFYNLTNQPFIFYDIGKVWNDGSVPDLSASSAGLGLRFSHDNNLSGSFTVAQPLTKKVDAPDYGNGKSPRFFFSLNCKF